MNTRKRIPPGNTKLIADMELVENCVRMYTSRRKQDKYLAIRILSKAFSKEVVKSILGCKESMFNAAINSGPGISK